VIAYSTKTGRTAFTLPAGVSSADGRWHVAATPLGPQTAITRFALVTGQPDKISLFPGRWSVGGVSPTGRWAAVVAPSSRSTTRLAIVDAVRGGFVHRVELNGRFEIETLSADGRRLFLIQHLDSSRYLVRLYDVAHGRLKTQALRASGQGAPMIGYAWSGVASPDGRWLLTLYLNTRHNHAFVHALDLERSAPACVDLPSGGKRLSSLQRYTLTLSPNGRTLFAANPALGVVAALDLNTLGVTRIARFAPSSAGRPTRRLSAGTISRDGRTLYFSAGTGLWAYDAAYGVVRGPYPTGGRIVGLGYGLRDRTVNAVLADGRMLTFAAATGRRLR
jgi:hypothetical protein